LRSIPLGGKLAAGRVAIVDDEDYELVSRHSWSIQERKRARKPSGPYAQAPGPEGSGPILMHKLITGWPMTDHINGNGLDNRRSNLRPVTNHQNRMNQSPQIGRASRFKGVTWDAQRQKWQARITFNYKQHALGRFTSEEDAARAYDAAATEMFGEFAWLNFRLGA